MDLHFVGRVTPRKALALIVGSYELFDPAHDLSLRVGPEKAVVTFGHSPTADVRISTHGIPTDLAVVLNRKIQGASIRYLPSRRRVIIVPNSESFIKASYPIQEAIRTEEIILQSKDVFGDAEIRDGDFVMANQIGSVSQDLVARIISSRDSATGFKFAAEYGSGWDRFVGRPRNAETIKLIEQDMMLALTKDQRYPVSGVRLFPVGENGLQPVIYFGPRVLNLPLQIDLKDGTVQEQ